MIEYRSSVNGIDSKLRSLAMFLLTSKMMKQLDQGNHLVH